MLFHKALLAEVRQLVPESIALDRLVVKSNVLEISGSAQQPNGLRLVNALLLRLSASENPEQVKLSKADLCRTSRAGASVLSAGFCCDAALAMVAPSCVLARRGWHAAGFGAGGFGEVTNFSIETNRPSTAWPLICRCLPWRVWR